MSSSMIVPRHTGHGLSDSVATDSRPFPEGTSKDCFRRCRDWSATGESGGPLVTFVGRRAVRPEPLRRGRT
jgi:hypothetical protein